MLRHASCQASYISDIPSFTVIYLKSVFTTSFSQTSTKLHIHNCCKKALLHSIVEHLKVHNSRIECHFFTQLKE